MAEPPRGATSPGAAWENGKKAAIPSPLDKRLDARATSASPEAGPGTCWSGDVATRNPAGSAASRACGPVLTARTHRRPLRGRLHFSKVLTHKIHVKPERSTKNYQPPLHKKAILNATCSLFGVAACRMSQGCTPRGAGAGVSWAPHRPALSCRWGDAGRTRRRGAGSAGGGLGASLGDARTAESDLFNSFHMDREKYERFRGLS